MKDCLGTDGLVLVILSDRLQLCYAISSASNGGFWSTAPRQFWQLQCLSPAVSLQPAFRFLMLAVQKSRRDPRLVNRRWGKGTP